MQTLTFQNFIAFGDRTSICLKLRFEDVNGVAKYYRISEELRVLPDDTSFGRLVVEACKRANTDLCGLMWGETNIVGQAAATVENLFHTIEWHSEFEDTDQAKAWYWLRHLAALNKMSNVLAMME